MATINLNSIGSRILRGIQVIEQGVVLKQFLMSVIAMTVFLESGCGRVSTHMHVTSEITFSISGKVDQSVEGGKTIETSRLGLVHLGTPLLEASFDNATEVLLQDIVFSDYNPMPIMYIPGQWFIDRPGVKGMSPAEIHQLLRSDKFSPGKVLFLVMESGDRRIVHQLTTGWRDDPTDVFIQSSFDDNELKMANVYKFDVREPMQSGDFQATEFKDSMNPSGGLLYGGKPVFSGRHNTVIHRFPWRFSIEKGAASSVEATPVEFADASLGDPVILTWQNNAGEAFAESALLWTSLPGFFFEMGTPSQLDEIKRDLGTLEYFPKSWRSINFDKSGVSVSSTSM